MPPNTFVRVVTTRADVSDVRVPAQQHSSRRHDSELGSDTGVCGLASDWSVEGIKNTLGTKQKKIGFERKSSRVHGVRPLIGTPSPSPWKETPRATQMFIEVTL